MKTISAQIPDTELSALVAEHVAGYTIDSEGCWLMEGIWINFEDRVSFSTSADAVLPLLEKSSEIVAITCSGSLRAWHVRLGLNNIFGETLARGACLCLLASRGFTITP